MAFDHSKFLARFADEAREHCAKITEGLLSLEGADQDPGVLDAVFRSAHTIKGSARMMKLTGIGELAHAMEDVLDAARSRRLALDRGLSDLLFKALDALASLIGRIGPDVQPEAPGELLEELRRAAKGPDDCPEPAPEQAGPETLPARAAQACGPPAGDHQGRGQAAGEYIRVKSDKLDELIRLMGELIAGHGLFNKDVQGLRGLERSARGRLESLAGGEGLAQALRRAMTGVCDGLTAQENLIAQLREASLKLRMLPLSTVFDPLRRTVRDLARDFGKDIRFTITGGETELDRKIAERIGDCLMHMIRNSLDHGLESAQERAAAGKPPVGAITLSAFYDSGGVTITLSDDGRGLSTEKIREKALAKRLLGAEELARMSRAEINNLIFLPGFSTSPIITDISGRGVGMDVVRKSVVDELKGSVMIETQEGAGSTFILRLPLNLAVFPLFFLASAGTVWAVAATSVKEMLCVDRGEIIDVVDKRAIRLRERIVPVEDLSAVLRLAPKPGPAKSRTVIVVVKDGDDQLGLVVDEIISRDEVVVKPLPAHLRRLRLVTGATVGEGGRVVNVLHGPELIRLARDVAGAGPRAEAQVEIAARILVVDDSVNTRELEKSLLEAYGYAVDTAGDGLEALEKIGGELYDLVITDIEMPGLNGFTLTERLRADQRYRHVPVIMVTSREKAEDKKRGVLAGADAYIVKRAFDQSNLLDTVKSLIG